MARPKLNTPKKQKLTLTVSEQTRLELAFISEHYGESISALVSEWAEKEAKAISRKTGTEPPYAGQLSIDDYNE